MSSGGYSLCTDEFGSGAFGLLPEVLAILTAVASLVQLYLCSCWGFQMKTTPLKITVRMWRRSQRRTIPRWGSVSNKLLGRLPEGE